jgi:hypothetical protein
LSGPNELSEGGEWSVIGKEAASRGFLFSGFPFLRGFEIKETILLTLAGKLFGR